VQNSPQDSSSNLRKLKKARSGLGSNRWNVWVPIGDSVSLEDVLKFVDPDGLNWGGHMSFLRFEDGYRVYYVYVYID